MPTQLSMTFASVHDLLLAVLSGKPSASEWRRYLAELEHRQDELCGILILQLTGRPSARRLRQLHLLFAGKRRVRVVLMTSSRLQRAVLTGLSWFADWEVAAFAPDDLQSALDFVLQGDGALLRQDVQRTLQGLRARLGFAERAAC